MGQGQQNDQGLDGMEAFMSQFADQGSDQRRAALDMLELQMAMLSEADRDFIIGTKAVFDTGGGLTPGAKARVYQIARRLNNAGHNNIATSAALSMVRVIKDLASVQQRLDPNEMEFCRQMAFKLKKGFPLNEHETRVLVGIHSKKGF